MIFIISCFIGNARALMLLGTQHRQAQLKSTVENVGGAQSTKVALAFILPPGILSGAMKMQTPAPKPISDTGDETSSDSSGSVGDKAGLKEITQEKPFPCPACPRLYRNRRSMQKHIRAHHRSASSSSASAPNAKQLSKSIFEDMAAMEQMPHACSLCPKRFSKEKYLKQHLSFHRRASTP